MAEAAVDVVAHGLWNWGSHRLDSTMVLPKEIKDVLDAEIKGKVGYIPTLQVINGLRELTDSNYLNDSELEHVLPKQLIEHYKANADAIGINQDCPASATQATDYAPVAVVLAAARLRGLQRAPR